MDNYRQIEDKLARHEPFRGSSATAIRTATGDYFVSSYSTVIAAVKDGEAWVSNEFYSPTTSRLQNMCRKLLG